MPWIPYPACQDGPVSVWRWIAWHISEWLDGHARRLNWWVLHGANDDDLPF